MRADWNLPPPHRLRRRILTGTPWRTGTGTNQRGAERNPVPSHRIPPRVVPMRGAPEEDRPSEADREGATKDEAAGVATGRRGKIRLPHRRLVRVPLRSPHARLAEPNHPKAMISDWGWKLRNSVRQRTWLASVVRRPMCATK